MFNSNNRLKLEWHFPIVRVPFKKFIEEKKDDHKNDKDKIEKYQLFFKNLNESIFE